MRQPTLLAVLVVGLGFAGGVVGAEPAVEFTGVLIFPDQTPSSLKTHAEGSSQFLASEGRFAGYTLVFHEPTEGYTMVAAPITYGDQEMRATMRQIRASSAFLNASKARMADALHDSPLTGERRAMREDSAQRRDERLKDAQAHVEQVALKAKPSLRTSLGS